MLVDGDAKFANKLLETLKETGTNVMDDVKYIKISGLPFIGSKLSDTEKQDLLAWAHKIVDSIQ